MISTASDKIAELTYTVQFKGLKNGYATPVWFTDNEEHEYFVMARMYHVVYIVYGTDTINAHRSCIQCNVMHAKNPHKAHA